MRGTKAERKKWDGLIAAANAFLDIARMNNRKVPPITAADRLRDIISRVSGVDIGGGR